MKLVKTLPILLSMGTALVSMNSWALLNDIAQLTHIQSEDAQIDEKQGIAIYTGDVIITQGSMKITGNTVTLTRTPSGDIDVVTSVGNLAYFEQKQATGDPAPMKGYGKTIQYQAQKNRILLVDQAKVIDTDGNTVEGEKITYDSVKKILQAGRDNGRKITVPGPRIEMIIHPKKEAPTNPASKQKAN